MKRILLLVAMATLLSGCISYSGGGAGDSDISTQGMGRGTTGVSSGADTGAEIPGSEFAPGPR